MAEWSKALHQSLRRRGFESHRCQVSFLHYEKLGRIQLDWNTKVTLLKGRSASPWFSTKRSLLALWQCSTIPAALICCCCCCRCCCCCCCCCCCFVASLQVGSSRFLRGKPAGKFLDQRFCPWNRLKHQGTLLKGISASPSPSCFTVTQPVSSSHKDSFNKIVIYQLLFCWITTSKFYGK